MIDFVIAVVMGGAMGWLVSLIVGRSATIGMFWYILAGCTGSLLGRLLLGAVVGRGFQDQAYDWRLLVTAFVGAAALLAVLDMMQRRPLR
jgi:uncharacterized membrane protein YeaQ/YmgE (transglycosylase-associated protein family)